LGGWSTPPNALALVSDGLSPGWAVWLIRLPYTRVILHGLIRLTIHESFCMSATIYFLPADLLVHAFCFPVEESMQRSYVLDMLQHLQAGLGQTSLRWKALCNGCDFDNSLQRANCQWQPTERKPPCNLGTKGLDSTLFATIYASSTL